METDIEKPDTSSTNEQSVAAGDAICATPFTDPNIEAVLDLPPFITPLPTKLIPVPDGPRFDSCE